MFKPEDGWYYPTGNHQFCPDLVWKVEGSNPAACKCLFNHLITLVLCNCPVTDVSGSEIKKGAQVRSKYCKSQGNWVKLV